MKKYLCLFLVALAPTLLSGCIIDDLADAIDEALGEDGDKTCGDALQGMISQIEKCTEGGYLQEGETAESKGEEWCSSNCGSLEDDVQLDEYANCAAKIAELDCEEIDGDPEQVKTVANCGWLVDDLGC